MTEALLFSLFPAVATLVGGLLALKIRLSKRNLSFALHVGAGVILGVVGVELMPRILTASPPSVILASFLAGSLSYVLLGWAAEKVGQRLAATSGGTFAIILGVGVDLLTDGMMVAAGQSAGGGLGLLLGLGLFAADLPESFSTVATVARQLSRRTSLIIALVFPALVLLGVPLGYLALTGQPEIVEYIILSFTAGMLVLVVVEGLVPEAHQLTRRQAGVAALCFSAGFTVFAALSIYLA